MKIAEKVEKKRKMLELLRLMCYTIPSLNHRFPKRPPWIRLRAANRKLYFELPIGEG